MVGGVIAVDMKPPCNTEKNWFDDQFIGWFGSAVIPDAPFVFLFAKNMCVSTKVCVLCANVCLIVSLPDA